MTAAAKGVRSWYSMKAFAGPDGQELEIRIDDEIGLFGVTATDFKDALDSHGDVQRIRVWMHSPGGSVFDGLAIYAMLRNHPAPVTVEIGGLAASIASYIAMAADEVIIPENGFMMVHKPWTMATGDAQELRDSADLLDTVERPMVAGYAQKTGQDPATVRELMEAETWLDAARAIELRFADTLAEEKQIAALERRGIAAQLAPKAPTDVEQHFFPPAEPEPVDPAALAQEALEARQRADRQRIDAIADPFRNDPNVAALFEGGAIYNQTPEQAREQIMTALGKDTTPTAGPSAAAIHAGNGNIIRDSAANSLQARIGLAEREPGNALADMPLAELARACLTHAGVSVHGMTRMGIVNAAITHSSSDFGSILVDAANKSLRRGAEEAPETFAAWTQAGTLSDFRTAHRAALSGLAGIREVPEGAEYKHVTVGDSGETIALATYGELLSITRQAIINDDLSAFDRIPRAMGLAAVRTVGDLAYGVLTGNPTMSDGKAVFHADHNNISTAALAADELGDAVKRMRLMTDTAGVPLNLQPQFLIVPPSLEQQAYTVINSSSIASEANSGVANPMQGRLEVIVEPRLEAHSTDNFYLIAGGGADTVEVAYLDGVQTPYLEEQQGFTIDGATFKVRIDAGVAPIDYRSMIRCTGGMPA
jgi:ATP-dependent protease ClpP protease subunit